MLSALFQIPEKEYNKLSKRKPTSKHEEKYTYVRIIEDDDSMQGSPKKQAVKKANPSTPNRASASKPSKSNNKSGNRSSAKAQKASKASKGKLNDQVKSNLASKAKSPKSPNQKKEKKLRDGGSLCNIGYRPY